jgi:hypothetical protein
MVTAHVEYVGFRSHEGTREYTLRIRHTDGRSDDFTLAIQDEAFLARRVRYQDAAEICFLKLQKALAAWESTPQSDPPARHLDVTNADLDEYREAHTAKPPVRRPKPPAPAPTS